MAEALNKESIEEYVARQERSKKSAPSQKERLTDALQSAKRSGLLGPENCDELLALVTERADG